MKSIGFSCLLDKKKEHATCWPPYTTGQRLDNRNLDVDQLTVDSAIINRLTVGEAIIDSAVIDSATITHAYITNFNMNDQGGSNVELDNLKLFTVKNESGTIVMSGHFLSTSDDITIP